MNCHACATVNPADAHFCSNCGVQIVAHTTGSNAAIADLVAAVDDGSVGVLPPTIPEPYQPAPPEPAPARSPTFQHDAIGTTPPQPPFAAHHTATRRASVLPILATVAAVVVLVGAGSFVLSRAGGDDPDSIVTPTDVATLPTTAPTTTPTTAPVTAPLAVDTTLAATSEDPPDTVAPTLPATAPPLSAPPDPAAVPPPPPEPGPVDAPGSPQVLANVQPSGPTYAEVQASFEIAQEFGDALALEDWERARQLSPELAGASDADFVQGYGNTNRVSLILRDARSDGNGYRLLLVSVAVENGGARTSLFCLEWAVDPDARTVDQRGGSKLATWDANAQPEAIRNDPAAMEVVTSCRYP